MKRCVCSVRPPEKPGSRHRAEHRTPAHRTWSWCHRRLLTFHLHPVVVTDPSGHLTPSLLSPHQPRTQGSASGPLRLLHPPLRVLIAQDNTWPPLFIVHLCCLVTPKGPSCPKHYQPLHSPPLPLTIFVTASITTLQVTCSLICLCAVFPTGKSVRHTGGPPALATAWLSEDGGWKRPDQPGTLVLPREKTPVLGPSQTPAGTPAAAALPKTDCRGPAWNSHWQAQEAGTPQGAGATPDTRCLTRSQSVGTLTWPSTTHPIASSISAAQRRRPV